MGKEIFNFKEKWANKGIDSSPKIEGQTNAYQPYENMVNLTNKRQLKLH